MSPSESPFPCHQADLLPLPFPMRGDFAWLADTRKHAHNIIGRVTVAENARSLHNLVVAAGQRGVELPKTFTQFMESPHLQSGVRSMTDCYLDLSSGLIPCPIGGGHLVRFLADSQGCVYWYLYLSSDGSDHAVVCSPVFHGVGEDEQPEAMTELSYLAESFEAFVCRFWLENEV